MRKAQIVTRLLYESDYASIRTEDVLLALAGDPRLKQCPRAELLETPVVKLTAAFGLVHSNGAWRGVRLRNSLLARDAGDPVLMMDWLTDGS